MTTSDKRGAILDFDTEAILGAMQRAVDRAVEAHRRDGDPIVVWRDGKVVEIPAGEIAPIDPKFLDDAPAAPSPAEREPARSA